jgi:hypothetical protein
MGFESTRKEILRLQIRRVNSVATYSQINLQFTYNYEHLFRIIHILYVIDARKYFANLKLNNAKYNRI